MKKYLVTTDAVQFEASNIAGIRAALKTKANTAKGIAREIAKDGGYCIIRRGGVVIFREGMGVDQS